MRVLGIDPGLTRCGIGVVEGDVGRPLRLVDVGVVRTSPDLHVAAAARAASSGASRPGSTSTGPTRSPSSGCSRGPTSARSWAPPRPAGSRWSCAARRGLPVALHTPSEVKAAVSGSGRADKAQVGAMVTRILRLDAPPKPADAADALALAITHIWRGGAQARIDAALAAAGSDGRIERPG